MNLIIPLYNYLLSTRFIKQLINRYFYSQSTVHYRMLEDRIRMEAYKQAIEKYVGEDDIVFDIGCGVGILSFLAAKKGCKKVYAVDNSSIIKQAKTIAIDNNLEDKITFFQKDLFSLKPTFKADVLLHEAIGAYVFDEGLIQMINYAKKNFLKEGGKILPNKIEIFLAPLSYQTESHKEIDFWSKKQYDLDFKSMLPLSLKTNQHYFKRPTMISLSNKNDFLAEEQRAYSIDLYEDIKVPETISMGFIAEKTGKLTGFCGFFKIYFDKEIYISTEPRVKNTHWMQFFLPFPNQIMIRKDEKITLKLKLNENVHKWSWMVTT